MSFQDSSDVVDSLLSDVNENFAKVSELSETLVGDSNVSFLGLLCGDLPSSVVWKMMYLCSRERRIEERCSMLSVLTDYVVNTPPLLEIRGVAHSSPGRMIRVLAQMWDTTLSYAWNVLNQTNFSALIRTLERCIQALRPYSLHVELFNVLLDARSRKDSIRTKMGDPLMDFPPIACISFSKIIDYRISAEQNLLMSAQHAGDQSSHASTRSSRPLVPASSVIFRSSSGLTSVSTMSHPTKSTRTRPTSSSVRSRLPKKSVVPDSKTVDSEQPIPKNMSASFAPAVGKYSTSSSKVVVAALLGHLGSSVASQDSEPPAISESPVPRTMSGSFALAMVTSTTSSPKVVAALLGPLRSISSPSDRAVGGPYLAVKCGTRRRLKLELHQKQRVSFVDADRSSPRGLSSYLSKSVHANPAHTNSARTDSAHTKPTIPASRVLSSESSKSTAFSKTYHAPARRGLLTKTPRHNHREEIKTLHLDEGSPALSYLSPRSDSRRTYSSPYAKKVLPVPAKNASPSWPVQVGQEVGGLKRRVRATCLAGSRCSSGRNVTEELFFDSQ